jgi:hypothetical protein
VEVNDCGNHWSLFTIRQQLQLYKFYRKCSCCKMLIKLTRAWLIAMKQYKFKTRKVTKDVWHNNQLFFT